MTDDTGAAGCARRPTVYLNWRCVPSGRRVGSQLNALIRAFVAPKALHRVPVLGTDDYKLLTRTVLFAINLRVVELDAMFVVRDDRAHTLL